MKNHGRKIIACLVLALFILAPIVSVYAQSLPTPESGTFPTGTFVVPMDSKQADRIRVYGFIHEFLRLTPSGEVARIIEPPDVTMQTGLTPSGALYQGGPFLIAQSFSAAISNMLMNSTFSKVTVTQLSVPFTSNQVFFVTQATKILVIRGIWGRTDLTLTRMGISYTIVTPMQVLNNPSMLNQYTLIVLDSPGWYGNPCPETLGCTYEALHSKIQAVYSTLQARVQAGNEVIYTDIAMLDLNSTFPGYVQLGHAGEAGAWPAVVYNPGKGNSQSYFPSQYYNPGPNPNNVRIFTESGGGLWVPIGVQPAHVQDVQVLMDSSRFGVPTIQYALLGFYFQYGNGIVEGLAFQPYQQLYPTYADLNGYYATYEIYGNKFVHGPTSTFFVSSTPQTVTVSQGQTASYTIGVTSVGTFSSPVSLQASGVPANAGATFSSGTVTPPQGGTVTSMLTVSTGMGTPVGSYNLTITGSSTLPAVTASTTITLVVTSAPADYSINISPNMLVLQPGQCGNVTATVQSFGGFSAPVTFTLSPLPIPHVTSTMFIPNPIRPPPGGSASSVLKMCVDNTATNASYTLTVTGTGPTSPPGPHTATLSFQIVAFPPPSTTLNWWLILLLLAMLFLAIAIALLAILKSRRGGLVGGRRRVRLVHVLPIPIIRCRFCGRNMPIYSVYCPYCGRPAVVMAPPPRPRPRAAILPPTRSGIFSFILALVSGILILVNSAALLMPGFYGQGVGWSSIFFWLPVIGPTYAFALGIFIGLTIILASVIMILSSGVLADVIIFPFAIFSLIIGGGFIAGMIIGIIAGILAALKR